MCGSFGKGSEGQLLACAQCAQCYHPYCVNSKVGTASVTSIILNLPKRRFKRVIFFRSPRRSSVRAGVVWSASCAKSVGRRRTRPVCCSVTTAMSAIIPTAWTLLCTLCRRGAGSANGKEERLLVCSSLYNSVPFELGQMEMSTCTFAYYVKH